MSEVSDDELLQRARSGSTAAFAALWRRHAGVAYSVAQTFRFLDADDIVSEAFTRVFEAMQAGKGPQTAFRAYLTKTVRNVGRYHFNRQPTVSEREREATEDLTAPSSEDIAVGAFEQSAIVAAFLSLPTRWQEVLWYSEVDGLKPRTVSGYIGIPPNAVSALAVRAKRGLRDAWITAQLATARSQECAAARREMGTQARGSLSRRAQEKLDAHIALCPSCLAALKEAEQLSALTLALFPVFAGTAGAAGYSALQPAPALPVAALPTGIDNSHAVVAAVGTNTRRRMHVVTAGVTSTVLLVVGVTGATIIGLREEPPGIESTAHVDNSPSVPPIPLPAPESTAVPSPSPITTLPAPNPITTPPAGSGGMVSNDSSTPSDQIRPGAVSPPGLPPLPAAIPLVAPAAILQQTDERYYPQVQGSDARRGAKIELIDEAGVVVGTATANSAGSWMSRVTAGAVGTHSIRTRQVVGTCTSASSAPMSYTVSAPPTVLSPAANQTVSAKEFLFSYVAPAGTVVQREMPGITAMQTITTPANGIWREYFSAPPGSHTVKLRYYEPQTGYYGPTNAYTFTTQ